MPVTRLGTVDEVFGGNQAVAAPPSRVRRLGSVQEVLGKRRLGAASQALGAAQDIAPAPTPVAIPQSNSDRLGMAVRSRLEKPEDFGLSRDQGVGEYLYERVPFAVPGLIDNTRAAYAASKLESGEPISDDDVNLMADVYAKQQFEAERESQKGILRKGLDIATHIPALATEIGLTWGAGTAIKQTATQGVKRILPKIVKELTEEGLKRAVSTQVGKTATKIALKGGGMATTAAVASQLQPGRIVNQMAESKQAVFNPETGEFEQGGDSLPKEYLGASVDQSIELFTERLGGEAISKAVGAVAGKVYGTAVGKSLTDTVGSLSGVQYASAVKRRVATWLAQKTGISVPKAMQRLADKGQYHGVFGEYMEERYGENLRAASDAILGTHISDPESSVTANLLEGDLGAALHQTAVEGIAFSIPGLASRAGGLAYRSAGFGYQHTTDHAQQWAEENEAEAKLLAKRYAETKQPDGKPISRTLFAGIGLPATTGQSKRTEFAKWVSENVATREATEQQGRAVRDQARAINPAEITLPQQNPVVEGVAAAPTMQRPLPEAPYVVPQPQDMPPPPTEEELDREAEERLARETNERYQEQQRLEQANRAFEEADDSSRFENFASTTGPVAGGVDESKSPYFGPSLMLDFTKRMARDATDLGFSKAQIDELKSMPLAAAKQKLHEKWMAQNGGAKNTEPPDILAEQNSGPSSVNEIPIQVPQPPPPPPRQSSLESLLPPEPGPAIDIDQDRPPIGADRQSRVAAIGRALPGAKVSAKSDSEYVLEVGGRRTRIIFPTHASVQPDDPAALAASAPGVKNPEAHGYFKVVDDDGTEYDSGFLVALSELTADEGTAKHEIRVHLGRALGLWKAPEWAGLERDHGRPALEVMANEGDLGGFGVRNVADLDTLKQQQPKLYDKLIEERIAEKSELWSGPEGLWNKFKLWLNDLLSNLGIVNVKGDTAFMRAERGDLAKRQATPPKKSGFKKRADYEQDAAMYAAAPRVPELVEAAKLMKSRLPTEPEAAKRDYSQAVSLYKPIRPLTSVPTVPSDKKLTYLNDKQVRLIGAARRLPAGTRVGLRIDINAFQRSVEAGDTVYPITVHPPAKGGRVGYPVYGYTGMARVKNPKFFIQDEEAGLLIATGEKNKFALATVEGEYVPGDESYVPPGVMKWTQVGYDPERHSYFYDKRNGEQVVGGDEAILVGNTVFVKTPKYAEEDTAMYSAKAGFKKKVTVNLSAAAENLPGLKKLHEESQKGDAKAVEQLHKVTTRTLGYFLEKNGIDPKRVTVKVKGLFEGSLEPSQLITLEFDPKDESSVVRAVREYADGLDQKQIHAREATDDRVGTTYNDGSYATPVQTFALSSPLTQAEVQKVIDGSGLYGLTYDDTFLETYHVGDPADKADRREWNRKVLAARRLLGERVAGTRRTTQRLWAYGVSTGGIGWPAGTEKAVHQRTGPATAAGKRSGAARKGAGLPFRNSSQTGPDPQTVSGVHYSQAARDELLGEHYGTGRKGQELKRIENASFMDGEHRLWRRVYFYLRDGDKLPKPEEGVGHIPHERTFDNIYVHGVSKPDGIDASGDENRFEVSVIEAGYDGYATPSRGALVLLDTKPIPVSEIERDVSYSARPISTPKDAARTYGDGTQPWSAGPLYPWVPTTIDNAATGEGRMYYIHPDGRKTKAVKYGPGLRTFMQASELAEREIPSEGDVLYSARTLSNLEKRKALGKEIGESLTEDELHAIGPRSIPIVIKQYHAIKYLEKHLEQFLKVGEAAGGGYIEGSMLVNELVGPERMRLWGLLTSAFSAQNAVPKHTVAGLDLSLRLYNFIGEKRRNPTRVEAKRLFDQTVIDARADGVAKKTVWLPKSISVLMKGFDATYRDLRSTAKENKREHVIGKVPNFGRSSSGAFGDVDHVVLDTYMVRVLTPELVGYEYVEGKTDKEGNELSAGQQLKEAQKSWLDSINNYLAYSALVRKVSREFGLKAGEGQERIWAAIYGIVGLNKLGFKQPLDHLTHEDIRAAWDLSAILLENPDVEAALVRHGVGSKALDRLRAKAGEITAAIRPRGLTGVAAKDVPQGTRKFAKGLQATGSTEGVMVSKRYKDEDITDFTMFSARKKFVRSANRWATWSKSSPETEEGKRLTAMMQKPDTKIGLRAINGYLAEAVHALMVNTKSQTTKWKPGLYLGGPKDKQGKPLATPFHTIFTRGSGVDVDFHELGHALSNVLNNLDSAKYQQWLKYYEPALHALANDRNGLSSVMNSTEEGLAEAIRLYVTDQGKLAKHTITTNRGVKTLLNGLDELFRNLAPQEYKVIRDVHRMYAAHQQLDPQLQRTINNRDTGYTNPKISEYTRDKFKKFLAALYGKHVNLSEVYKQAFEDVSGERQSGLDNIKGIAKLFIRGKAARARYQANITSAAQVLDKIAKEGGDIRGAYNTLARLGAEASRVVHGSTTKQTGLRVMAAEGGFNRVLSKAEISYGLSIGLPMNFAEVNQGEYLYLVDGQGKQIKLYHEIKADVGEKDWNDFETYGQTKTSLARYTKYLQLLRQWQRAKARGVDAPPPREMNYPQMDDHPPFPDPKRPGASLQEQVEAIEKAHPEWVDSYKDVERFMDGLLSIAVLSGELPFNQAVKIKEAYDHYWPQSRVQREGQGEGQLDPQDMDYDLKRAFGSDLPFRKLDDIVYARTMKAFSAYSYGRLLDSMLAFRRGVAKNSKGGLMKRVKWMQMLVPLKVDMEAVKVRPDEEAQIIADGINRTESKRLGLTLDDYLQTYGGVEPDDVIVSSPSKILWREAKPKLTNVIARTRNGKKQYFYVPDPFLIDLFSSQPNLSRDWPAMTAILESLGDMIAPLKRVITQSLPFAAHNAFYRDPKTAMLTGKGKRSLKPYLYTYKALRSIYRGYTGSMLPHEKEAWNEIWTVFSQGTSPIHGFKTSFKEMWEEGTYKKRGQRIKWRPSEVGWPKTLLTMPGIAASWSLKLIDIANWSTGGWYLSPRGEAMTRVGAYIDAVENGANQEQAVSAGDNATANFNQRSLNQIVNLVDKQAMFLNARNQVHYAFYQKLFDPDPRVRGLALLKLPYAAALHGALLASLYVAMNALGMGDWMDDWLKEENERTNEDKARMGALPILGGHLRIPFDDGLPGMFDSLGHNIALSALAGDNPLKQAHEIVFRAQNLVGPTLSQWMNPAFRTVIENQLNYQLYNTQNIVPPGVVNVYEPKLQTTPSTPASYSVLAEWLDKFAIEASPMKIRHLVQNLGLRYVDQIAAFADKRSPKEAGNLPLFGQFFTKTPRGFSSQSVRELSEMDMKFASARKELQQVVAGGDEARAAEAAARLQSLAGYRAAWSQVESIWRQAKKLRDAGRTDDAFQAERLMTETARRALRQLAEFESQREMQ